MPMVGIRSRSVIAAASCVGHQLEDDRERARLLERERVGEHRAAPFAGLALDPELAAERVDRLRRPADVAHHRDAGAHDRLDVRALRTPPSILTACAPPPA